MADHKPMIIRMPNERGGQSADVIAAKRLAEACKHLHELARAAELIPDLLATPAAVRFVMAGAVKSKMPPISVNLMIREFPK